MTGANKFKIRAAVSYSRNYAELPDQVGTELIEVAKRFVANIARIGVLLQLPLNAAYDAYAQAGAMSVGREKNHFGAMQILTPEQSFLVDNEAREILSRHNAKISEDTVAASAAAETCLRNFDQLIDNWCAGGSISEDRTTDGITALFSSAIIAAWTAFEVLVEAAWVAALNSRIRLAFMAFDADILPTDDESTKQRKNNVRFPFPFHKLREPGLVVSNEMGEILRDKWDFSNQFKAKEAYQAAFRYWRDDLDPIFDNQKLKWLAAIRHVLVHNNGIADLDFEKSIKGHPTLGASPKGQPIQVDGELVNEALVTSAASAKELLAFLNKWMQNNLA